MATNFLSSETRNQTIAPPLAEMPVTFSVSRRSDLEMLVHADRACCCSAKPAVVAIMPRSCARPAPIGLLFCMHHFREARDGLAAAGAVVLDRDGKEVRDCWLDLRGQ